MDTKKSYKFIKDVIAFIAVVGSALSMWNVGKLVSNTESPIVVVLTGSMEPAFQRGDLLLVTHLPEELLVGDIIVFKTPNHEIPIVHRAMLIQIHQTQQSEPKYQLRLLDQGLNFLTKHPFEEEFNLLSKGDNNPVDDRGLYPKNTIWLNKEHIIGKIRAYCPYIGYITILINEKPILKYTLIGAMLFSVMISKDPESK